MQDYLSPASVACVHECVCVCVCVYTEQEELAYRENKCRGEGVRGCHKLLRTKSEHSFECLSLRRHHERRYVS
jgi:hypothetical protein